MKTTIFFLLCVSATLANPVTFQGFTSTNNKFAASVYKEVASQNKENFLVSPLSAQLVLALSQAGARGSTAREIQNALKFPPCQNLINNEIRNLLENLEREHDYVLHTVNKMYLKENCSVREEFKSVAQEFYGAQIENIDFSLREEAAQTINQWVEEETDNKIHDLIDPAILTNETRAVLLNALHFKANWSTPFAFFTTMKQSFHLQDGTIKVDTMHIYEEVFQWYDKPHLNATFLELPIVGDNVSMTLVLPSDKNGLATLEKNIDQVLEVPEVTYQEMFNVALPKFKIESRIDFKQVLQNLGVKKAFEDGRADFSGIAGQKGELFIDDVVQKTFLDVNEDGMEAAAATFVVKIVNRNAETPRDFRVDHPFLFFVKVEGLVVFIGRIIIPYY